MGLDPARAVENYQQQKLRDARGNQEKQELDVDSDEDIDRLLENLEDDEDLAWIREKRLAELKKEVSKIDKAADRYGSDLGSVVHVSTEKELMDMVTASDSCVVHFFQPEFSRCKVMNERLAQVAEKHVELRVLAIRAEDAPFLVQKLKLKVLPVVVAYLNGKEAGRVVGFEGLLHNSGTDFPVESLETWLAQQRVVSRKALSFAANTKKAVSAESDDDDWY